MSIDEKALSAVADAIATYFGKCHPDLGPQPLECAEIAIEAYEAARAAFAEQGDECSDALAVLQHAYDYCQKRDLSDGKYIERAIYTAMSRLRDWYRGCASAFQADENGFESLVTLQIASPAPPKRPSPIGINEADGERG
jgi:hypothetical protein